MKDINQESVTQCGRGSKKTPDYWSLKNSKLPKSNKHVYLKQVSVKVFHLNMCVRLCIVDIVKGSLQWEVGFIYLVGNTVP